MVKHLANCSTEICMCKSTSEDNTARQKTGKETTCHADLYNSTILGGGVGCNPPSIYDILFLPAYIQTICYHVQQATVAFIFEASSALLN